MSWSWDSLSSALNSTLSAVQDDLQEFVGTIQGDTAGVVRDTREVIQEVSHAQNLEDGAHTAFQHFGQTMNQISSSLKDDSGFSKGFSRSRTSKKDQAPMTESREEAQARSLRHDPKTYTDEPSNIGKFAVWNETFDIAEHVTKISGLLSTDGTLRKIHAQMVPRKVSYNQFWIRYFYALHELKMQGEKRKALLDKIDDDDKEENALDDWGDDTWGGNDDDVTPKKKTSEKKATLKPTTPPPPASTPKGVKKKKKVVEPVVVQSTDERFVRLAESEDVEDLLAAIKTFDAEYTNEHGTKPNAKQRKPIEFLVKRWKKVNADAKRAAREARKQTPSPPTPTPTTTTTTTTPPTAKPTTDTATTANTNINTNTNTNTNTGKAVDEVNESGTADKTMRDRGRYSIASSLSSLSGTMSVERVMADSGSHMVVDSSGADDEASSTTTDDSPPSRDECASPEEQDISNDGDITVDADDNEYDDNDDDNNDENDVDDNDNNEKDDDGADVDEDDDADDDDVDGQPTTVNANNNAAMDAKEENQLSSHHQQEQHDQQDQQQQQHQQQQQQHDDLNGGISRSPAINENDDKHQYSVNKTGDVDQASTIQDDDNQRSDDEKPNEEEGKEHVEGEVERQEHHHQQQQQQQQHEEAEEEEEEEEEEDEEDSADEEEDNAGEEVHTNDTTTTTTTTTVDNGTTSPSLPPPTTATTATTPPTTTPSAQVGVVEGGVATLHTMDVEAATTTASESTTNNETQDIVDGNSTQLQHNVVELNAIATPTVNDTDTASSQHIGQQNVVESSSPVESDGQGSFQDVDEPSSSGSSFEELDSLEQEQVMEKQKDNAEGDDEDWGDWE